MALITISYSVHNGFTQDGVLVSLQQSTHTHTQTLTQLLFLPLITWSFKMAVIISCFGLILDLYPKHLVSCISKSLCSISVASNGVLSNACPPLVDGPRGDDAQGIIKQLSIFQFIRAKEGSGRGDRRRRRKNQSHSNTCSCAATRDHLVIPVGYRS